MFEFASKKIVVALVAATALMASAVPGRSAELIDITVDFAEILRLERPAGMIVIGNPAVADATISDGRTLVLTGLATGMTNMIILDREGAELSNYTVRVGTNGRSHVSVLGGESARNFFCSPACEPVQPSRRDEAIAANNAVISASQQENADAGDSGSADEAAAAGQ